MSAGLVLHYFTVHYYSFVFLHLQTCISLYWFIMSSVHCFSSQQPPLFATHTRFYISHISRNVQCRHGRQGILSFRKLWEEGGRLETRASPALSPCNSKFCALSSEFVHNKAGGIYNGHCTLNTENLCILRSLEEWIWIPLHMTLEVFTGN